MLFYFDIFHNFIRISAGNQKTSKISHNKVLHRIMIVTIASLHPLELSKIIICMFRVLYQDWGTFKFDFLSKIRILRYILSSTLCDEFHHKKKSSGDMVQLNGFIWTISYVKWTDLPFCHFLTLIMENYSKIQAT